MTNQPRPRRDAATLPAQVKRWLVALGLLLAALLTVLLLVAGLVLHLPASMLNDSVVSISHGDVRLILPTGQIRSGRAELWVRDATRREWMPWMPVEWRITPVWRDGAPALVLASNLGTAQFDRAGVTMSDVQLSLPPSLLLARVNHPLAKAPWRGDIELAFSRLVCDWAGLRRDLPSCDGQAIMHWRGMGSAILPLQEIGSYAATISADSKNRGRWRADLSTESGVVAVAGFAEIRSGAVSFRIGIKGDPELMVGLDSIAGSALKKRGNTGEFMLEGAW